MKFLMTVGDISKIKWIFRINLENVYRYNTLIKMRVEI